MIVIDTNVVSELMRRVAAAAVLEWFDRQVPEALHFNAVGEAELRFGVALLPAGRRRDDLMAAVEMVAEREFAGRVLPFDSAAAAAYAIIAAAQRADGRPIAQADCQIAAIARSRGAAIATRNIRDFLDCGIDVLDPWQRSAPEG